jgi:predicted DNA-binding transcriptional regulator YafY
MAGDVPIKVVRIFRLLDSLSKFPPKTIDKLAQMIDVSPKTVYKDIHIITSLGYDIDKDDQHRYYIKNSAPHQYHLEDAEKKLIIGLVKEAGLNTNTINSITQKLKSKTYPDASNFKMMKQLNVIRILIDAIAQKMPVILIQYQSTTLGSKKRDRHVLPLYFDEMRMTFTAFDYEKGQAQLFKVSRMEDITLASGKDYGSIPENLPIVDAFGFAGNMAFDVNLLLSKRAATLLTEEFLLSGQYLQSGADEMFPYVFHSKVCGYEGVGRFVLGMMTEIKVVGDEGFKSYLKMKIREMTILGN